jgi:hypothetical protein
MIRQEPSMRYNVSNVIVTVVVVQEYILSLGVLYMGIFKSVWEGKNHEKMIDYALKLCKKGKFAEVAAHIRTGQIRYIWKDFNPRDVYTLVCRMTDENQIAELLIAGGYEAENIRDSTSYNSQMQMHEFRRKWVNTVLNRITTEELLSEIALKIPSSYAGSEKVSSAPLLCRDIIMKMTNVDLLT